MSNCFVGAARSLAADGLIPLWTHAVVHARWKALCALAHLVVSAPQLGDQVFDLDVYHSERLLAPAKGCRRVRC